MAQTINSFTTCPEDCGDDNMLPAIDAVQDCNSYTQELSQVHTLYLMPQVGGTPSADPFTNFATTPTVTAAAIDNTKTDNSKAKFLVGDGGVAESTPTVVEYPKLGEKVDERLYELVFNVRNLSDAQYAFLQQLQCGNTDITFYYSSGMGTVVYVYGKQGGIVPKKVDVSLPKGGGRTDRDLGIIKIQWLAKGDPDRRLDPYA